jgi:DNA-binding transcriptional ArsR family regulator
MCRIAVATAYPAAIRDLRRAAARRCTCQVLSYNRMVVCMQISPPDFDRLFAALADHTRRDIVRRAIGGQEGVAEVAGHYPMSFAAVQKHVAILERAGLITKERIGRRKVVRTNLDALLVARRLLDQYEELWRARIERMNDLITETADTVNTTEPEESNQ